MEQINYKNNTPSKYFENTKNPIFDGKIKQVVRTMSDRFI